MKKILLFVFLLFTVFVFPNIAYASDFGSFNWSWKDSSGLNHVSTVTNIKNASTTVPDEEAKIYSFASIFDDGYTHFIVMADVPFTLDINYKQGANVINRTLSAPYSKYNWFSYSSTGSLNGGSSNGCTSISGYYGLSFYVENSVSDLISYSGFTKVWKNEYSSTGAGKFSALAVELPDYFFTLPPTLKPQPKPQQGLEVVGEVLLTYLGWGIFLVILLIAFLIFCSLLKTVFHRSAL